MSSPDVVIVDYGMGNLLSVRRGLERCGAAVIVTSDHAEILNAARIVLPGVGAFSDGMNELRREGLDAIVCDMAARGVPLLGICLGMQMLLDQSTEFGITKGLGLIPGQVIPIPAVTGDGLPLKIPHIGWNALSVSPPRHSWSHTVLENVSPGESVYFVHSFMAAPAAPSHRIADCNYGGIPISAVIARENVQGCQFHPEKSGEVGIKILKSFLSQ